MKVAVVTPTIATPYLQQCIDSVAKQTYNDVVHYIFIDGEQYVDAVKSVPKTNKIKTIALEENIGKGWYGHRVYAACSFLVNADVICYLDEDNWLDPDHVESLVATIKAGNDWAYSLRKIYNKQGEYVCNDDCESLGKWPVYFNEQVHHIDTSSFAVLRDIALVIGHAWYGQWGADRQFFANLSKYFPNYGCSGKYSLNYRLEGNQGSVNEDFFKQGNEVMKKKYKTYPWVK